MKNFTCGPKLLGFTLEKYEKAGVCLFKNDSLRELEGTSEVICHNPLIIHRIGETLTMGVHNPGGLPSG